MGSKAWTYGTYGMSEPLEQKAKEPETDFARFVRAIFAVPKAAIEKAEALRPKKPRSGKHKNGSAT